MSRSALIERIAICLWWIALLLVSSTMKDEIFGWFRFPAAGAHAVIALTCAVALVRRRDTPDTASSWTWPSVVFTALFAGGAVGMMVWAMVR